MAPELSGFQSVQMTGGTHMQFMAGTDEPKERQSVTKFLLTPEFGRPNEKSVAETDSILTRQGVSKNSMFEG